MSEPFIGEVRIFAGNFAPRGWAFCDGSLLPIAQNTALFSILGTTYGGDGRSTLGLPDLRGRAPMHPGRGPGLTSRQLGQRTGAEAVTLTQAQTPNHSHSVSGLLSDEAANTDTPGEDTNIAFSEQISGQSINGFSDSTNTQMAGFSNTGGSQPHNNMQPFLTVNYIIALTGLYPSRN